MSGPDYDVWYIIYRNTSLNCNTTSLLEFFSHRVQSYCRTGIIWQRYMLKFGIEICYEVRGHLLDILCFLFCPTVMHLMSCISVNHMKCLRRPRTTFPGVNSEGHSEGCVEQLPAGGEIWTRAVQTDDQNHLWG